MDESNRSHFIVPKSGISQVPIDKTGGGATYKRGDLQSHGQSLLRNFSAISSSLKTLKDYDVSDSITVSVTTPTDWPVKREKGHLEELGFRVLDYSRARVNLATVSIPKSRWVEVGSKISNYAETGGDGRTNLQAIDEFLPRPSSESLAIVVEEKVQTVRATITFFNILKATELKLVSEMVREHLIGSGGSARLIEFSDNDVFVACEASPSSLVGIAESFSSVRSIVNDEEVFIERASMRSMNQITALTGPPETTQIIGIVDDGVFPRSDLATLVKIRVAPQVPSAVAPISTHGTFVASRSVFGDLDPNATGGKLTPTCYVADIPVFGLDSSGAKVAPTEIDLVKAVDDFVSKHHRIVKVYNLSLGFGQPHLRNRFSETAKRLDFLSKKYDVLFVVSAGNITKLLGQYPVDHFDSPLATILSPSESLLCLCVGSIAKRAKPGSLSQVNEISAFSRIGPGLFGSVKPDLVAHGGNIQSPYSPDPDVAPFGFSTSNGVIDNDVGTSFSAPIVSNYAAQIFDYYPMFGTNMVRALLISSARERSFPQSVSLPSHTGCGYGEPDIRDCLQGASNACIYLADGILTTENYELVHFYVPSCVSTGKQNLTVKVTIVFDPEVNRNNDLEYSCSRVSATLLKPTKGKLAVKAPSESNLSEPYSTVVQFSSLFKKNVPSGMWAVRLRLYARNVDQVGYSQKYSIVINVVDELNGNDLRTFVVGETGDVYVKLLAERKRA